MAVPLNSNREPTEDNLIARTVILADDPSARRVIANPAMRNVIDPSAVTRYKNSKLNHHRRGMVSVFSVAAAGEFSHDVAHKTLGVAQEHEGFVEVIKRVIDAGEGGGSGYA
jgi:hypothetical protein